ncbi:LIC_13246 family protein, partial [Leptospira santarosai]
KHVFRIYAEILEKTKVLREEFIFIDGIAEARDVFERDGNMTNHPVFNIRCLSDLYKDNIK